MAKKVTIRNTAVNTGIVNYGGTINCENVAVGPGATIVTGRDDELGLDEEDDAR